MKTIALCLALCASIAAAQTLGEIQNFQVKTSGDDYIELEWSITQTTDYPLHKYTLTTDNDFSNDVRCPAEHCTFTVDYLPACSSHTFELVPHFDGPSGDVLGDVAYTDGNTADKPPGAPSNIAITGSTVSWDAPTVNAACVGEYKVCYNIQGETTNSCEMSNDTSLALSTLEACCTYQIEVTSVGKTGSQGESQTISIDSGDGVPGSPQNVQVGISTVDSITIQWDDPLINRFCVDRFAFSYGETTYRSIGYAKSWDHEAIISPLMGCTNYTVDVFAVSKTGVFSDIVTKFAATAETEPLAPPSVIVGANGPESIDVIWGSNQDERCAGCITICWHDHQHPETCETIPAGGGNNFTITDLIPCSDYDIDVSVVTPGGIPGNSSGNSTVTDDVRPGPVRELRTSEVLPHQLTISYEAPETHPQCVHEYDIEVINEDDVRSNRAKVTPYMDGTFTDLSACADYTVRVRAVTRKGLRSEWRETTTVTGDDVPSAPRSLEYSFVDQTSVSLTWWLPNTNQLCTSKYRLEWTDGSATYSTDISKPSGQDMPFETEHLVSGLTPCTEYTFSVIAVSSVSGDSPADTLVVKTVC